jgi:adenosylmethionine-8-amino-7-oxononanoate aminotransferase
VLERVKNLQALQRQHLNHFREDDRFENIRQTGTIAAMDLKVADPGYFAQIGPRLRASFRAANVLLRPLGNTVYVMPPYCVTREDLDTIYGAISAAADAIF